MRRRDLASLDLVAFKTDLNLRNIRWLDNIIVILSQQDTNLYHSLLQREIQILTKKDFYLILNIQL